MKNPIYILLLLFLVSSCDDDPIMIQEELEPDLSKHELVGEWSYQREVVTEFS